MNAQSTTPNAQLEQLLFEIEGYGADVFRNTNIVATNSTICAGRFRSLLLQVRKYGWYVQLGKLFNETSQASGGYKESVTAP